MHEIVIVRPMSPSKSIFPNQIFPIAENRVVFVRESVVLVVISIRHLLKSTLVQSELVLMDDVRTIGGSLGQFLSIDPSIVLVLLATLGSLREMLFPELVYGE
jgi:hypothetical protein